MKPENIQKIINTGTPAERIKLYFENKHRETVGEPPLLNKVQSLSILASLNKAEEKYYIRYSNVEELKSDLLK